MRGKTAHEIRLCFLVVKLKAYTFKCFCLRLTFSIPIFLVLEYSVIIVIIMG